MSEAKPGAGSANKAAAPLQAAEAVRLYGELVRGGTSKDEARQEAFANLDPTQEAVATDLIDAVEYGFDGDEERASAKAALQTKLEQIPEDVLEERERQALQRRIDEVDDRRSVSQLEKDLGALSGTGERVVKKSVYSENSPPPGEERVTKNLRRKIIVTPDGSVYRLSGDFAPKGGEYRGKKGRYWLLMEKERPNNFTINRGVNAGQTWDFDFDALDYFEVKQTPSGATGSSQPTTATTASVASVNPAQPIAPGAPRPGVPTDAAAQLRALDEAQARGIPQLRSMIESLRSAGQPVPPRLEALLAAYDGTGSTGRAAPGNPPPPPPPRPGQRGTLEQDFKNERDALRNRLHDLHDLNNREVPAGDGRSGFEQRINDVWTSVYNLTATDANRRTVADAQQTVDAIEREMRAAIAAAALPLPRIPPRTRPRFRYEPPAGGAPGGRRVAYLDGEALNARMQSTAEKVVAADDDTAAQKHIEALLSRVAPGDRAHIADEFKDALREHLLSADDADDFDDEVERIETLVDQALEEVEKRDQERAGRRVAGLRSPIPNPMDDSYRDNLLNRIAIREAEGVDPRYAPITPAQTAAAAEAAAAGDPQPQAILAARTAAIEARDRELTSLKAQLTALGMQQEQVGAAVAGSPAAGQINAAFNSIKTRSIAQILHDEKERIVQETRNQGGIWPKVRGTFAYLWRWQRKSFLLGAAAGAALSAGTVATGGTLLGVGTLAGASGVGAALGAMRTRFDVRSAREIVDKDLAAARAAGDASRVQILEAEAQALTGWEGVGKRANQAWKNAAIGALGGAVGFGARGAIGWMAGLWPTGGGGGSAAAAAAATPPPTPTPGAGAARVATGAATPPPVVSNVPGTTIQNGPFRPPVYAAGAPRARVGYPFWYGGPRGAPPPLVIGKAQIDAVANGVLIDRFGRPSACGIDHHARGLLLQNRNMRTALPRLKIMETDTNWWGGKRCLERLVGAPPRVGETFIAEGTAQGRGIVRAPNGDLIRFRTPRFSAGMADSLQEIPQRSAPRVVPFEIEPPTRGGGRLADAMPNGMRGPQGGFASNLFAEAAQVRRGGSITVGEGFLGSTAGSTGIDGYVDKTLFGERGVLNALSPKSKEIFTDVVRQTLRRDEGLLRSFFNLGSGGSVARFFDGADIKFIDGTKMNPAVLGRSGVIGEILERISRLPDSEPAFAALKSELGALASNSGGGNKFAQNIGNALSLKSIPGEGVNAPPVPVRPTPPTNFGDPQQVA